MPKRTLKVWYGGNDAYKTAAKYIVHSTYMHSETRVILEETISIIMTFRKHQFRFLAYHVTKYIVNFIDPPYVILRFIVICWLISDSTLFNNVLSLCSRFSLSQHFEMMKIAQGKKQTLR